VFVCVCVCVCVFRKCHSKQTPYDPFAADIWQLGATLFVLLTASLPFPPEDGYKKNQGAQANNKLYQALSGDRPESFWHEFDKQLFAKDTTGQDVRTFQEARRLLQGMLCPEPAARWTLKDIQKDPWMDGELVEYVAS
jgi:serine/threonine protein kinase